MPQVGEHFALGDSGSGEKRCRLNLIEFLEWRGLSLPAFLQYPGRCPIIRLWLKDAQLVKYTFQGVQDAGLMMRGKMSRREIIQEVQQKRHLMDIKQDPAQRLVEAVKFILF